MVTNLTRTQVENVLVGKNGALYLIDFGSATTVTYDTDKVETTPDALQPLPSLEVSS